MCTPCPPWPPPRLMTGTGRVPARYSVTSWVVTSVMMEKHPASTKAIASSTSSLARSAVLPWAKKPPSWAMRMGVMPIWPCTGTPALTIASTFGA